MLQHARGSVACRAEPGNPRTTQLRKLLREPGILKGRNIHEATSHIPVIGDGDTGYGNALNVQRTVKGYAQAGFAGILIEDQAWPKSCGHLGGKQVVSREEAVARVKAAVDARCALRP
ncbi:uncharacterized protein HaLaN_29505 [Haematococcus lacustris]|uniref:Isocitrate lyase n=1 Tax=Haematococcus lacustris TaxID=44745 RepID=A0A6A0ACR2_HAELA|nr:uncharacterized protein HaLaN_29505 [Haematococcus lacustris]